MLARPPSLFASSAVQVLGQGPDLARDRESHLPVCTRVQTRSLSSLPRTLLRLISYSVAGCSLVMVNSLTVLGTTELSSRPTAEENPPSASSGPLVDAARGLARAKSRRLYREEPPAAPGDGARMTAGPHAQRGVKRAGSRTDGECRSLKRPWHAAPTPSFYRLRGAKEKERLIRWLWNGPVFLGAG